MQMTISVDFELRHCPDCGIHYYVPTAYMDECRRDPSQYFHCPAGHRRHFSESEADKLRRERDRLKQETARLEDSARAQRERAEKAERANKNLKKRAAAGTCPCCQRTFQNMATHMKRQHPNFVSATGAKVVPIKQPA